MKQKFILFAVIILTAISGASNAQNWSLTGNTGTNAKDFLGTSDKKNLVFKTSGIERMRVGMAGNIGIGITLPDARLNIDSGTAVSLSGGTGYLVLGNKASGNMVMDYNTIQSRSSGAAGSLYLNNFGGNTYIGKSAGGIVVSADGTVGITGTNNAAYALSINASASLNGINITDPVNNYSLLCTKSGDAGEGLRMNISSTTNVYSAIRGHTAGNGFGVLAEATGTDGEGVEGYSSQSFGVYGGTGNSNSYAGYFSGNVFSSGNYLGSDQKLKQNIQDFSNAMDIINQLQPKQYQFRQDGNYKLMNLPTGEHYGLIAQDVEKVLPELVKNTKFDPVKAMPLSDGSNLKNTDPIIFKAVNYTELIPLLIKGMQEQQLVNDKQQLQIQQQQMQIDQLSGIIQNLTAGKIITGQQSSDSNTGSAGLIQNAPNPFNSSTVISYTLPQTFSSAQIIIADKSGNALKQINVSGNGKGSVTLDAGSLSSGAYSYSLLIDGKLIETKQMILAK